MAHLLIFGPGYTARRIAEQARAASWTVDTIGRDRIELTDIVQEAIGNASHILSSVPPEGDEDPVLLRHGSAIAGCNAKWIGYLSSTGVYGDSGGAWIDETAAVAGRRPARNRADRNWSAIHPQARVFRLPGIYGPGRSPFERLRTGTAARVDVPGQIFSRVHVDDIAAGVLASMERGPPGVYNLADDLPAPQHEVVAFAASLIGVPVPPLQSLEEARLSPAARAFYAENRRVANGKARRLLGWRPLHATYRQGLTACLKLIQ